MNRLIETLLLIASLTFLNTGAFAAKEDAKAVSTDKPAAAAVAPAAKAKASAPMDLNTASEKELATLPQIGDARAKAIVAGRPYARKDELVSKKILGQKVYDGIKDSVIAKQGAPAAADKNAAADKKK
jgi:competence protein ComEA